MAALDPAIQGHVKDFVVSLWMMAASEAGHDVE
jgi:hypothetical protein